MAQHTLYAYVDGSNLRGIAHDLETQLARFIEGSEWRSNRPWVVNQRHDNDPTLGPGDLPDWELGLNVDLPDPDDEPPGWFSDIESIAQFLAVLRTISGRDFVIGICDNQRGYSEDLFFINSTEPDLSALRKIIGVKD